MSVRGGSLVLVGMGIGLVAGASAGTAIGNAAADETPRNGYGWSPSFPGLTGGIAGGLIGMAAGGLVATNIAGSEEYDIGSPADLNRFREFARYEDKEPEFLATLVH